MEERNQNEKAISFSEIWLVARSNLAWLILIVLFCVGLGATYAYMFKKTTYTASIDVGVQALYDVNKDESNKFAITTAYQYSAMLAPEYEKVMKSHEIISKINANKEFDILNVNAGALTFNYTEGSAYFKISYSYSKLGGDASEIKTKVANTLNNYVNECIEILHANESGNYLFLADNLIIISSANDKLVSDNDYSNKISTIAISGLIGLVIACLLVILIYFVDDRISTRDDAERLSGVSVLAFIDISSNAQLDSNNSKKGGNK